jgi:hypothetical protein
LVRGYGNLFDKKDEEDDETTEEEVTPTDKWVWVRCIDRVSETTKLNWYEVLEMNCLFFFNILCYTKDKADEQEKAINKYRQKH